MKLKSVNLESNAFTTLPMTIPKEYSHCEITKVTKKARLRSVGYKADNNIAISACPSFVSDLTTCHNLAN